MKRAQNIIMVLMPLLPGCSISKMATPKQCLKLGQIQKLQRISYLANTGGETWAGSVLPPACAAF